jgi:diamine N-acetyltransferase
MKITKATKDQLSIVRDLAYKIWPSTYLSIISKAQLDYMLDKFYSVESLKNQMLENDQIFLLIEDNNEYLGFCAYELNVADSKKTKLHKIYVLPSTQGKGIGKLLLAEVEKTAKNNKNTSVYLNVNRNNNAQNFYLMQGYTILKTEDIDIGFGYLMEDYVMEKKSK